MDLKSACKYESEGNFERALIAYQSIEINSLSNTDKIYIKRLIAACLFYLKKYEEAEFNFKNLLSLKELDVEELDEIEDCLNICYLYGHKQKKAFQYFMKKIIKHEIDDLEKMWSYWYVGQYHQMENDFIKCYSAYKKSYEISHLLNITNKAFFFAHYLIAFIYLDKLKEALSEIDKYEKAYENSVSFGLLKITKGIIYKIQKRQNWNEIFIEGIKEAEEARYQENIDIGMKLKKEFG